MWKHWTVRTCHPEEPFRNFVLAQKFWTSLFQSFPKALSAVLMPNHLHLILPSGEEKPLFKLSGLLGPISRIYQQKKIWQPIPEPTIIPDRHHLRRQLRYVALNPCRKGLCADPMEWYWSTYREVLGATVDQVDRARRLASALNENDKKFEVRFHAYVSADPSFHVSGTPLPILAIPGKYSEYSIHEILDASSAALRLHPTEAKKKRGCLRALFIHMAYRYHWNRPKVLAKICEMSVSGVHLILKKSPPFGIEAAELCLGDRRLRRQVIDPIIDKK